MFQFVLTRDGWCGLCYEHSCAEGIVVIQLVEQVLHAISEKSFESDTSIETPGTPQTVPDATANLTNPQRLEWSVTPVISRKIQDSADNLDRYASFGLTD